jgi:hypothetical protein
VKGFLIMSKNLEGKRKQLDTSEGLGISSTSGNRPHLSHAEGNLAGNNVDPESQTSSVQAFMRAAKEETRRLKAKLTAERGNPEEYRPEYQSRLQAEKNFQADNIARKREHLSYIKDFRGVRGVRSSTGDTLVEGSSQHKAKQSSPDSDSDLYSSNSETEFETVTGDLTFGFFAKPENSDTKTVPNNPDGYRRQVVNEGYHPAPPQSLWDAWHNYFSSNRQKTEHLVRLRDAKQRSSEYKGLLDRNTKEDLQLAKKIAEDFFKEDINELKEYLGQNEDKIETEEYKREKDKLDDLKKRRSDFQSEVGKKLSDNAERSHKLFLQNLEEIATEYGKSGKFSLFKVSSFFRLGGLS